jgi:hypothetical protein
VTQDNHILTTVAGIVEEFGISLGAVRVWIAAGHLVPVRREGRGRGGMMLFSRGQVKALLHGVCLVCGSGFRKAVLKQRFCSTSCRQKWSRMHKGQ